MIYRFGGFVLDRRTGELRRETRRIPLQEKPRLLLQALLERPGELVTRDELRERLWPGVHVDFDRGLGNAVQKVREALGDSAEHPAMVETLPRRGYRLLVSVDRVPAPVGAVPPSLPPQKLDGRAAVPAGATIVALVLSLTLAWSRPHPAAGRDPEAWEAYRRGVHFSAQKTPQGLEKAVACFHQAIESDPELAPAWAGLAEAYHFLGAVGVLSPADAYRRASESAHRAVRLDASLAEAHAILAETNFRFGPDDDRAQQGFERALELRPDSATIRHWRANYLVHKGRPTEGLREMEEALRLEPTSLHVAVDLAGLLYDAGRRDEAYARLRKTIELDDRFPKAHFILGHLYWEEKRFEDAIEALKRASELAPDTPKFLAPLAAAYADAGRREEALATVERIRALGGRRHLPAELIARIEARFRTGSS